MESRLDFSDLIEFTDVPDTILGTPFAEGPHATGTTLQGEDGVGMMPAAPVPDAFGAAPDLATRCLAKLTDVAAAAVLYGLASAFFSDWLVGFLVGALAASAYLLVSDGLDVDFMKRRSLGKRVMGLTVERVDGSRCDLVGSVRRNWMFTVIFFAQAFTFAAPALSWLILLAALGLVGYEVYWVVTNPDGVRWGDDLAGTEVLQPVSTASTAAR